MQTCRSACAAAVFALVVVVGFETSSGAASVSQPAGVAQRLQATAAKFRYFNGMVGDARSIAFSPNVSLAITGHWNRTVKLWSVKTRRQLREFDGGHDASVLSAAFCADGASAVTGSIDGVVSLWDVASGNRSQSMVLEDAGWAASVACAGAGAAAVVLAGAHGGHARLWDADGATLRDLALDDQGVTAVALSSDATTALTASRSGSAALWDTASASLVGRALKGHKGWILCAAFSPDGEKALTGSHDGTAKLWDARSGRLLRTLGPGLGSVNAIAFSADGRLALTASGDLVARIWDVDAGEPLRSEKISGSALAVSFASGRGQGRGAAEALIGWLRRIRPEPDRSDRDKCEANCAAEAAAEQREKMPIFEVF